MGRKTAGATVRDQVATIRLNAEESAELERKRKRRMLSVSDYFRTRLKEDDDGEA